jgi:hypothetical protein
MDKVLDTIIGQVRTIARLQGESLSPMAVVTCTDPLSGFDLDKLYSFPQAPNV